MQRAIGPWLASAFLVTLTCCRPLDDLCPDCQYTVSLGTMVTCNYENSSTIPRLLGDNRPYLEQESWKSLEITGNSNITSFPLHYFTGVKDIETLGLHGTRLRSIPDIFANLQQVFTMDLSLNEIEVLRTKNIHKLGIHHLNVSRNVLRSLTQEELSWIPSVEVLDLSNNRIRDIPDNSFKSTSLIRKLILTSNSLSTISEHMFSGLETNLKELFLGQNQISQIHPLAFSKLLELKLLDLSYNPLTLEFDFNSIKLPQHIVHLDLQRTGLQTLHFCSLHYLHDIEYINLEGNDLSCVCDLVWINQLLNRHYYPSPQSPMQQRPLQCQELSNGTVNVSSIATDCSNRTRPQCSGPTALAQLQLQLQSLHYMVNIRKGKIFLHWSNLNSSLIYAYRVDVREEDEEDEYFYGPVTIHPSSNSFKIDSYELENTRLHVCLHVMANESYDLHTKCIYVENESMNSIVGILAGIIFLIPCIIGLSLVIYHDRKHQLQAESMRRLLYLDSDSEDEAKNVYKQDVCDDVVIDSSENKKRKLHDGIVLNSKDLSDSVSGISVKFIKEDPVSIQQSDISIVNSENSYKSMDTDSQTPEDSSFANYEPQSL